METPVWALPQLKAALTDLATNLFDDCRVILFTNDIALDQNTVLADLTLATFDGYAQSSILTFSDPVNAEDSGAEIVPGHALFICTGDTTPNTIRGYALLNGTPPATKLVYAVKYDTPKEVAVEGDFVRVEPAMVLRNLTEV